MKKILITTDSHGKISDIYGIIENAKFDSVINLGDYCEEAEELSFVFTEIPFYVVKGNCDFYNTKYREIEIIDIENKKILITHGHLFGVKNSIEILEKEAEKLGIDIVLFGHTHIPYLNRKNGILYCNPGALKDGRYGILSIDEEKIDCELKNLK